MTQTSSRCPTSVSVLFFFSSRRRHTRLQGDWSSDVCSSDLIIVVDFIDMESRGNRDKVLQELRAHLGRDRARTKAFAVSELGLIEMTRQQIGRASCRERV